MSQFDVAIGIDTTTLDTGIGQLYTDSQAREKLFKGEYEGRAESLPYKAGWDIQAAPIFILEPPPQDRWQSSINDQGLHPRSEDRPAQNAFQLVFPRFYAQYTQGSVSPVSGTTEVMIFATIAIKDDQPSIFLQSVWFDESKMPGWDKLILNQIIVKQVLLQVQHLLAGLPLSPLTPPFSGISLELTPPQVIIDNHSIIIAASLASRGSVDISEAQWPDQPLFVLLSADLLKQVVQHLAAEFVGHSFNGDGDYKGIGKYSWNATLNSLDSITIGPGDMTKLTTQVGFSFDATLKPLGVGGPCAVSTATASL